LRALGREYGAAFDAYAGPRSQLSAEGDQLREDGRALRGAIADAMGVAEMLGAQQALLDLADARQALMLGRYYGRSALASASRADAARSRQEFDQMLVQIERVRATAPDMLDQLLGVLEADVQAFAVRYVQAVDTALQINAVAVDQLDQIGPQMADAVGRLVAENVALQDQIGGDIRGALDGQRNFTIVLGMTGALVAVAAAAMVMGMILSNLGAVISAIARVRSGELDFEVQGATRSDEIGDLARAVEELRTGEQRRLELEAEARASEAERKARSEATHNAIDTFRTQVEAILSVLGERTHEMRHTAGELNALATKAGAQARSADGAAADTAKSVETVAAAAEELASSIQEISRLAGGASETVQMASEQSRDSVTQIEALADRVASINDVIDLINDIAEQTNLLALNATIEAARAGEAGKGFAVVASEVKDLAEQTGKATETVAGLVKDIQGSMTGSLESIRGIAKMSDQVNDATASIAAAVEEQGAATAEISDSTNRAADNTSTLANGVRDVGQAVADTEKAAGVLEQTSDAFTSQADTLRASVEEFFAALKEGPLNRRVADDPDYDGPERRGAGTGASASARKAA
jgi:methyl-accepting chemotaxis protein